MKKQTRFICSIRGYDNVLLKQKSEKAKRYFCTSVFTTSSTCCLLSLPSVHRLGRRSLTLPNPSSSSQCQRHTCCFKHNIVCKIFEHPIMISPSILFTGCTLRKQFIFQASKLHSVHLYIHSTYTNKVTHRIDSRC